MLQIVQTSVGLFGPPASHINRRIDALQSCNDAIDALLADGFFPGLVRVESEGKQPNIATMVTARLALAKLPIGMLRALLGKQIEITAEVIDPDCPDAIGLANASRAKIAGRLDGSALEETILHETFHLIDALNNNHFSSWVRWSYAWTNDLKNGIVPAINNQRTNRAEYFAECGMKYYLSDSHRAKLSPAVQDFFAALEKKFSKC